MNDVRRCFSAVCVLLFLAVGMPVFGEAAGGDASGAVTVDDTAEGGEGSAAGMGEPAPAAVPEASPVTAMEPAPEDAPAVETPLHADDAGPAAVGKTVAPTRGAGKKQTVRETPASAGSHRDPADMAGTPAVVTVLQKKESQLIEARNEIARLREIVKKIADANRREQSAMHYNLGCAYKAAGDPRKAESELLKSLELDPQDAATHYNLGVLYDDDLKDKKKAKEHYQKYLLLAPDSKDAVTVLEWVKSL